MDNTLYGWTRFVKELYTDELLAKSNVIGVGIGEKVTSGFGTGEVAIIVSVVEKRSSDRLSRLDIVPKRVGGVKTDVVETGVVRALDYGTSNTATVDRTGRWRPCPGGVSIGHYAITAGTLGCWVLVDDQWMALSNCHVLANSNDAEIGDAILQPGPYDGGTIADQLGTLYDYVPITFEGDTDNPCKVAKVVVDSLNRIAELLGSSVRLDYSRQSEPNLVDAALMVPLREIDVSRVILDLGVPTGIGSANLGDAVSKSGRTSGTTSGTIAQVDATVQVEYGNEKVALMEDQLVSTMKSQGGDSGSAILNTNSEVVGLLFAGSDTITICNRIENVAAALGVDAVGVTG